MARPCCLIWRNTASRKIFHTDALTLTPALVRARNPGPSKHKNSKADLRQSLEDAMSSLAGETFLFCGGVFLLSFVAIFAFWAAERLRGGGAPRPR